ncbi:MAG: metabolite traffic protein EboE [Planctomycetaceae bacterium]|nr:metabolite traffic protein EboE [Planctomycetaceae bacterium]
MTFSTLPLSYCTNVHPGRTVAEVVSGLNEHTAAVRRLCGVPMAAGLWLSRSVASELPADTAALELLAQTLWQNDLSCYTLNTFPYGDFHSDRVKEQVYLPDWTSADRLNYTKDCAKLLAELLPAGAEGSLSTVPLGGRMNPSRPDFHAACFRNLIQMGRFLKTLEDDTGRRIRLAVEPEPMCEISSVPHDAVPMFSTLFEMADALGHEDVIRKYVGLCLDICHQAVEFENTAESVRQLQAAEIRINKVHITNAVELPNPAQNADGREALKAFVEPRYLHQTYARMSDGSVLKRTDLTCGDLSADPDDPFLQAEAWRVHFHVPVYADEMGPLRTTRNDLRAALKAVDALDYAPHLEVETYTWPVMPDSNDAETLASKLCRELESAADLLASA